MAVFAFPFLHFEVFHTAASANGQRIHPKVSDRRSDPVTLLKRDCLLGTIIMKMKDTMMQIRKYIVKTGWVWANNSIPISFPTILYGFSD
jgi:hypothetical protein